MSILSIRPFTSDDESEVISLWERCGLIVAHNDPRKDIARKQKVDPDWFLVGELDDSIVATCMVGYDGHRGCINYLAVDPNHQSKGYGRMMTEKAEEFLLDAGCPKVNLLVRGTNESGVAFYHSLGYTDNECLSLGKRLIPD